MHKGVNWLGIMLFFLCACNRGNKEGEEDYAFERIIELSGREVFESELSQRVEIAGDFLLFEQSAKVSGSALYHVYRAKDLGFIGTVGERGQVPYGFIGAQYSGQYYVKDEQTMFWVNDAPRHRISAINVNESLQSEFAVIDSVIDHNPQYGFMNSLFVLENGGLAGYQPSFSKTRNKHPLYIFPGNKSDGLGHAGEYPVVRNIENIPNASGLEHVFKRLSMAIKPDESRLVVAFTFYDRLDIYDKSGELIKSVRHPDYYEEYNSFNVIDMSLKSKVKNINYYYQSVGVSDDFIFALCYNKRRYELYNEASSKVQIRVFDWSGDTVCLLNCPNDLVSICVDEKNRKLYGYNRSTESFMQYNIDMLFE